MTRWKSVSRRPAERCTSAMDGGGIEPRARMLRSVSLRSLLLVVIACACAPKGRVPSEPPASEPPASEPEVVLDPVATPASPCTGHDGLVIDPIRPIVSDWHGQVVVGGQAPVILRWCGEGMVTVASISVVQPATEGSPARALHERVPDPAHERLAHGQSLIVEVHAPARPGLVEVVVLATDEHARPQTARAPLESVEDPARVAHRRECAAAGGHWGPHGMAGVESCDRPTRDAGQRCTSDADCESACIDDGDEPLGASPPAGAEVPSCEPGAQPRLVVGRCSARTLPFGCRARLPRVTIECVAPGIGRRAHTICVD